MTSEQWEQAPEVDQVEAVRDTEPAPPPTEPHNEKPIGKVYPGFEAGADGLYYARPCELCGQPYDHAPECPHCKAVAP